MAVRFDAAADRLTHDGTYPQPSSAITVTAWVRIVVDQNEFTTFCRLFVSGVETSITFGTQADGTSGPGHFTGGGSAAFGDSLGAVATWVPVATTRAATAAKVYRKVGGTGSTTSASGTITGVTGTPNRICLGGRGSTDATEWLSGDLAYVRIWAAELSQSEIEAEWASATPVRTSGLHSDWPLATATDLTDTVGGKTLAVQSGGALATTDGPDLGGGTVEGTIGGSLPAIAGDLAATVTDAGAIAGQLPALAGSLAATVTTAGQISGLLPAIAGELAGGSPVTGVIGGQLPAITGQLVDTVPTVGRWRAGAPTRPPRWRTGAPS